MWIKWAWDVAPMGEKRNACKVLVGVPEGNSYAYMES
jgi:hypothetical protein